MLTKKNIRQQFRKSVLERDKQTCRVCGKSAKNTTLEVHHITDRNEIPKGGYVLSNGISLCAGCHFRAEEYHVYEGKKWTEGYHPDELYELIGSSKIQAFLDSVDLNAAKFSPYFEEMGRTPQEAKWHAEGDVLVHTFMVVKELMKLSEYKELPKNEQHLLCIAALLHDIAKPKCTIIENGEIRSPRHAKVGEKMVRELLWDEDFEWRETICSLVRLHGLPLWSLEKAMPNKAVIGASLRLRNSLLYILTKADILGRICEDQADLLERLAFFKELCIENECYETPKVFHNAHSRFHFFQQSSSDYPANRFDDTAFEIIILCGIAGSGKDTYAAQQHLPIVSLDAFRQQFNAKRGDKKAQGQVIQAAYEQAKVYCRQKQSFIWNSTNLTKDMRSKLIRTLGVYNPRFRIVYIETSLGNLLSRRKQQIPDAAIFRMLRQLDMPEWGETHGLDWERN